MTADHPGRATLAPDATAPGVGAPDAAAPDAGSGGETSARFSVRLDVFEGPFDLLLGLIAKHKLDVTEVALSRVTDEFIAFIRARGPDWDLDEATQFLVVAATLLDLKAARLLPSGDVEDEEDLALLEARDLLFARLLQYRAFKEVAAILATRYEAEARRWPRVVGIEESYASLLPEVLVGVTAAQFARLAAVALAPKPIPTVAMEHLHVAQVSVREQAGILVQRLRRLRVATFRSLAADADSLLVTVARFLALLELYRDGAVAFEQLDPLGELHVRWAGRDDADADADLSGFDEFEGAGDLPTIEGRSDQQALGTRRGLV